MKLVIAEKPSVAQSLARVIGADKRRDGYLEGGGYLVSWCVGHLVELSAPERYDERFAKWRLEDLPILPERWLYEVPQATGKQYQILKTLMERSDVTSLVCATDAGREGELIFRLVYNQARCKKPFERLWISSMEDAAIREGFEKLNPGTQYDALYEAALCRERADWIVGMNATRLFSCLYGQTLAVGRVMTPTLAMVVMRDAQIAAFNLMELSKDGRWMGGQTPTGFDKQRVATGSGKNKSAVSFLVPIPEQREQIQLIFKKFLETRSYNRTCVYMNENGYVTKNGLPFRLRAISDILHNPVYCTADSTAYHFFYDNGANVAGSIEDFDGKHALSGYNKTDHIKDEHEDSTFFNPKFTQLSYRKPINDWIISVGKHEPFISSEAWIAAQELMKDIEEQHNRPHRATNALLSGLMICPKCGKILNVVSESGRWTRGRPRFKYVCPGHRKKECDYLAVDGVKLDDQVVRQLAVLVDEQKETYFKLIEARIRELTRSDASEREYQETKKDIEKIKADIAAQIRNLREADDVLRKFIQDDVNEMSAELSRKEAILLKLEEERGDNSQIIEDLSQVKKKLTDFKESWKTATPEELMSMVRAVVERVYVIYEDEEPIAHIFLKGCIKEDYTSFFDTAGYIPFTGNGVLKVNLCVIQNHENDEKEGIHTQMSQADQTRELYSYLCGRPAPERLCRDYE